MAPVSQEQAQSFSLSAMGKGIILWEYWKLILEVVLLSLYY